MWSWERKNAVWAAELEHKLNLMQMKDNYVSTKKKRTEEIHSAMAKRMAFCVFECHILWIQFHWTWFPSSTSLRVYHENKIHKLKITLAIFFKWTLALEWKKKERERIGRLIAKQTMLLATRKEGGFVFNGKMSIIILSSHFIN